MHTGGHSCAGMATTRFSAPALAISLGLLICDFGRLGLISFNASDWHPREIEDLLRVEDEMSARRLYLYDKHRSGLLQRRAVSLLLHARKTVS